MTLPDYHFISAPLWLVTTLHLLTLSLHLAAMSCLFGGALIVLWAGVRKQWAGPDAAGFVRVLPAATAATVSLGVAPLLFLQLVYPRQVYAAAIVSGWFWLAVIGAVITAYYAFYRTSFQAHRTGQVSLGLLALAALGLLYTSLVYSSVFALAEQPTCSGHSTRRISPAGSGTPLWVPTACAGSTWCWAPSPWAGSS